MCCANVAGSFVSTDMLLSGLQSQSEGLFAIGIPCDSYYTSRHQPLEGVSGSKEASMRPSIAHWNSKSLAVHHSHIKAYFSWRSEDGEGHEVCGAYGQGLKIDVRYDEAITKLFQTSYQNIYNMQKFC